MSWTPGQLEQYHEQGFLLERGLIGGAELESVLASVPALLSGDDEQDGMHRERERGGAVRQVYLAHRHNEAFRMLSRHPRITEPVRQVLENDFYVWHSKLNVKDAFEGTVWLWHQDYGYWFHDGVEPRMMSVMVLLDRATLHNGCLMVVSGSHRWGRLDHGPDTVTTSYRQWRIPTEIMRERLCEEMITPITGEPGDVLFFDCNLVHGSNHNLSPLPRNVFIVAYNDVNNRPTDVEKPRPDWVVARQFDVV